MNVGKIPGPGAAPWWGFRHRPLQARCRIAKSRLINGLGHIARPLRRLPRTWYATCFNAIATEAQTPDSGPHHFVGPLRGDGEQHMNTTIGQFRLKQKIEEDVLGEVYCASRLGEASDESPREIVLLRLFKRGGLDPERFLAQIESRRQLVGAELGEQLTTSRELGVADGRAFDVFPYASGRSLYSLIEVTTRQRERFPLAVALFIAGRLATGLGVAFRQEIDGECLVHGFVLPHLIRVSEEGSVCLGGLETASALQDFRGTASTFAELLPYLSPERRAGRVSHPADDVYSLGALLYQLLTLRPLASASDLRAESRAIPSELRYFLARSVAERSRRIQSVVEWLRELKALVVQEGWTASAQDLSSFLAEVDERVRPLKPDTTEITASDKEEYARIIRQARAKRAAEASEAESDVEAESEADQAAATSAAAGTKPSKGTSERPPRGTSYDTSVITGEDLKPLFTEGKLVKTSHVKRASSSMLF